jgi:predicted nucleic acid-binding protein
MGIVLEALRKLETSRVYFDANIFVYALEGISPFVEELKEVFESVDIGEITAFTSELSLAECLVKPYIEKDVLRQEIFEQALTTSDTFKVLPVDRQLLKDAASLRATYTALRLPDAIHIATALSDQCVFLTNDIRLKVVPELQFLILKDYIRY